MTQKNYVLEIPRPQYDRLGDAFPEFDEDWFLSFDTKKDTIKFSVTESQRKYLAKFAKKKDNPEVPKTFRATYWITQLFLPKNINKYTVT